ncbi:hypothetical protein ABW20_dc0105086 [Dactylellina cionopaga]|nr:hypothetical protein ABW20_dc0105086 [Dactylellina cionopaga]
MEDATFTPLTEPPSPSSRASRSSVILRFRDWVSSGLSNQTTQRSASSPHPQAPSQQVDPEVEENTTGHESDDTVEIVDTSSDHDIDVNPNIPWLPTDIWLQVFGYISAMDTRGVGRLSQVSKRFHQLANSLLYRDYNLSVGPHSYNLFIEVASRYLSASQLKFVTGSHASVPGGDVIPSSVGYVKRIFFHRVSPKKEHIESVTRCIEELLVNLRNVEVFV